MEVLLWQKDEERAEAKNQNLAKLRRNAKAEREKHSGFV